MGGPGSGRRKGSGTSVFKAQHLKRTKGEPKSQLAKNKQYFKGSARDKWHGK